MHLFKSKTPGKNHLFISLFLMCLGFNASGQISPGELTTSHAHLEGILNCTKCHVLGDKVSNEKCLECHKEIKHLVDGKKGYHASSDIAGKNCSSCHSDHHGRNFEIVRFDQDRFNHQLTGYKLTGAHLELDCNACHKNEFIKSYELKKKKYTYLGLTTDCIGCHKDIHQNTLSTNCASCHNTEAFAPAALFEHDKTDFPLKGKHRNVDCLKCHEETFTNNALFQRFAGVPFSSCVNCHQDVHNNQFGNKCAACHNEESFHVFVGKNTFNHNQTDYPLVGKHRKVDCAGCHQIGGNTDVKNAFQDYKGRDFLTCVTCHRDVHDAKFGTDCRKCHNEESFQKTLNTSQFEHDLTGYPLKGKHELVDCRKCHETKLTDPVVHNRCADCHADFHQGQLVRNTYQPDCGECHQVDGFTGSSYTIEKHNEGPFPLKGAHLATPCFACHLKDGNWSFRNIGQQCLDCHVNAHEGFLNEKYLQHESCNQCHLSDGWAQVSFDHQLTGFELQGKHARVSCVNCHKPDSTQAPKRVIPLSGLKTECTSCHENIHGRQFDIESVTDCKRCHGFEEWKPSKFNHNAVRFVLDGAHKNVACNKCHKEKKEKDGMVIQYRMEQFECATCHL